MAEQSSERASARAPEIVLIGNEDSPDLTLLDLIDHVLNTGVIIRGNLVLSLAGVDLVYLGLDLIVSSVETALRHMANPGPKRRLDGEAPLKRRSGH